MKFSERQGYKQPRLQVQTDDIDSILRNYLWNRIYVRVLTLVEHKYASECKHELILFMNSIWVHYFHNRIDERVKPDLFIEYLKRHFFSAKWFEVYDIIENVIQFYPKYYDGFPVESFVEELNYTLAQNLAGYRIIDNKIVPIVDRIEINEVNEVYSINDKYAGARLHIASAVTLLSNRSSPDYRNCIKESISAVESVCSVIASDQNATLGKALKIVSDKHKIHPALKESFMKLYGYTSDDDGIRHKLLEKDNLTLADAKFFLVSCSAFINLLIEKSES